MMNILMSVIEHGKIDFISLALFSSFVIPVPSVVTEDWYIPDYSDALRSREPGRITDFPVERRSFLFAYLQGCSRGDPRFGPSRALSRFLFRRVQTDRGIDWSHENLHQDHLAVLLLFDPENEIWFGQLLGKIDARFMTMTAFYALSAEKGLVLLFQTLS
jgi:hypothetical protein